MSGQWGKRAILPSNCSGLCVKDCQTEYIFECQANIVANGPHKSAGQSPTKRTEGWQKFFSRQNSLVFFCSKLQMLQQEAESSRMSRLTKVSQRENSSVFWHQTANAPPRGRVIKQRLFGQISFFITALLAGLLADAKLQLAGLTTYRQTS